MAENRPSPQGNAIVAIRIAQELLDARSAGEAPDRAAIANRYGCSILDVVYVERTEVYKSMLLDALTARGLGPQQMAQIIADGIKATRTKRHKETGEVLARDPDWEVRLKFLRLFFDFQYGNMGKSAANLSLHLDINAGGNQTVLPPTVPATPDDRVKAAKRAVARAERAGKAAAATVEASCEVVDDDA